MGQEPGDDAVVTTRDKLSELRKDAVESLKFAIRYITAPESPTLSIDPDTRRSGIELHRSQRDLAVMGAVQAQAHYTLACQMCVQCGHRMIEHSVDDDPPSDMCECCVRVGKMMKEDQV